MDRNLKDGEQNHVTGGCTSRGIPVPLQNPKDQINDQFQDQLQFSLGVISIFLVVSENKKVAYSKWKGEGRRVPFPS